MAARPLAEVLPPEERETIRAGWMGEPGFYNPWLHLAVTSVFGSAVVIAGLCALRGPTWSDLLFGAFLFVLSNATEWRLHKDVLHRRRPPLQLLYDRHTPLHHMVFITDDLNIRHAREFRMVLLPPYAIVAAFVGLLPVILLLAFEGHRNLAAVFAIETLGYIVSYEWLHLSYHLPPDSLVGSWRLVRFLRRHHAIHHDPRLMQRWNFNVSLPLWDLVRRTYVRDRDAALAQKN